MTAIDCPETSRTIYKLCKERKIPVNVADVPSECDFYFGSQYRDGPLQVMVSTNGNGPKLANIIREQIAAGIPENAGDAITKVGKLRQKLREMAPGNEQGPKRMKWMIQVCEKWTLNDFISMSEQDMDELLQNYESGIVPPAKDIISEEFS
ncbi:Siroheme biosynthesis protein met8 [Neolecta irregularis DAH-3]|uniref:precorrin-2 dehydrogenase n=1 Tax=Neolecta irregularis (strain DAH-3) TaxID=1198029 RepID=A0A1U7LNU6_NEOID|nr:Siroheme biosynthesis protein met8 [Neolecta irregularis DAH-3]|eukprot:OLL24263.1 Siroheme biosynthesis protein met8 [Neolecta irregularis DAH-3]